MLRPFRLALVVLCTLSVWLCASTAMASGAFCDDIGASGIAVSPVVITSQSTTEASADDAASVESSPLPAITSTPSVLTIEGGQSSAALAAAIRPFNDCSPSPGEAKAAFHSIDGEARRGVVRALDRPPRISSR